MQGRRVLPRVLSASPVLCAGRELPSGAAGGKAPQHVAVRRPDLCWLELPAGSQRHQPALGPERAYPIFRSVIPPDALSHPPDEQAAPRGCTDTPSNSEESHSPLQWCHATVEFDAGRMARWRSDRYIADAVRCAWYLEEHACRLLLHVSVGKKKRCGSRRRVTDRSRMRSRIQAVGRGRLAQREATSVLAVQKPGSKVCEVTPEEK